MVSQPLVQVEVERVMMPRVMMLRVMMQRVRMERVMMLTSPSVVLSKATSHFRILQLVWCGMR